MTGDNSLHISLEKGLRGSQKRIDIMIVKTIQNRKNKMKKSWKDCLRNQKKSRRDLIRGKDLPMREE